MRRCRVCRGPISQCRLQALPQTQVCVKCSSESPLLGVMIYSHKTAPFIQVVAQKEFDTYKRYDRKGVRSGLPMSPRTVSGTTGSVMPVASNRPSILRTDATVPRARCGHDDRPQVGASGKCVECATAYYAMRVKKD